MIIQIKGNCFYWFIYFFLIGVLRRTREYFPGTRATSMHYRDPFSNMPWKMHNHTPSLTEIYGFLSSNFLSCTCIHGPLPTPSYPDAALSQGVCPAAADAFLRTLWFLHPKKTCSASCPNILSMASINNQINKWLCTGVRRSHLFRCGQ